MNEYSEKYFKHLKEKYPHCTPIILQSECLLDRNKYLINQEMSVGNFMCYIRQRNKLKHFEAYFMFADNILLQQSQTIQDVYNLYANNKNKFLFITIKKENTFG
jgi:hypothetical protein